MWAAFLIFCVTVWLIVPPLTSNLLLLVGALIFSLARQKSLNLSLKTLRQHDRIDPDVVSHVAGREFEYRDARRRRLLAEAGIGP